MAGTWAVHRPPAQSSGVMSVLPEQLGATHWVPPARSSTRPSRCSCRSRRRCLAACAMQIVVRVGAELDRAAGAVGALALGRRRAGLARAPRAGPVEQRGHAVGAETLRQSLPMVPLLAVGAAGGAPGRGPAAVDVRLAAVLVAVVAAEHAVAAVGEGAAAGLAQRGAVLGRAAAHRQTDAAAAAGAGRGAVGVALSSRTAPRRCTPRGGPRGAGPAGGVLLDDAPAAARVGDAPGAGVGRVGVVGGGVVAARAVADDLLQQSPGIWAGLVEVGVPAAVLVTRTWRRCAGCRSRPLAPARSVSSHAAQSPFASRGGQGSCPCRCCTPSRAGAPARRACPRRSTRRRRSRPARWARWARRWGRPRSWPSRPRRSPWRSPATGTTPGVGVPSVMLV